MQRVLGPAEDDTLICTVRVDYLVANYLGILVENLAPRKGVGGGGNCRAWAKNAERSQRPAKGVVKLMMQLVCQRIFLHAWQYPLGWVQAQPK